LFNPVFDELNRRGAVVFIHPAHCEAPTETNLHAPPFVVEYVFDTTRAIVNLIHSGALKRCPDIRLIVAHGGGAAPFLAQRIAMMEGHRGAKGVTGVIATLRSLYYEIASTTSAFALRSLQELADPAHILWGSDLPFVYEARLQEEVDHWEHYDGFDAAGRAAVEELNALELFPRFA
jgi:predicted TIM-barrel fold metal-dependent hydrolase